MPRERSNQIRTTQLEQSILCVLYAAEPRSLRLTQVADEIMDKHAANIAWALRTLEASKLIERGVADPSTWQLTESGRKYWKDLVQNAATRQEDNHAN